MKSTFLRPVIFIGLLFLAAGCDDWFDGDCENGHGPVVSRVLTLQPFHGIELNGSGKVFITQGDEQEMTVEAQENVIDLIKLKVADGRWRIDYSDCLNKFSEPVFYITIPEVNYLGVNGSGDIETTNQIATEELFLKISGSGNISADVEAIDIVARISGSGNIHLSGDAEDANFETAGSGNISAFGLISEYCNVKIAGSGNADVNVLEELDVSISGSGNVRYKGSPQVDASISGSGKLINAN